MIFPRTHLFIDNTKERVQVSESSDFSTLQIAVRDQEANK